MKKTRPLGASCIDQPEGRSSSDTAAAADGWRLAGESKELWRDCDELGVADACERWFDEPEELSE